MPSRPAIVTGHRPLLRRRCRDLAFDLQTGASRAAVRAAGPVERPGLAQLPVTLGPAFGGVTLTWKRSAARRSDHRLPTTHWATGVD
jgi:hypothetical protein